MGESGDVLDDSLKICCGDKKSIKVLEIQRQGKKLQKTYDEYVKVTDKVKKTRKSVFQIEAAEKKMALTIAPPPDWGSLGEPPSPPKLIRQSADYLGALSPLPTTNIQTPEPVNSEVIPESWEDL